MAAYFNELGNWLNCRFMGLPPDQWNQKLRKRPRRIGILKSGQDESDTEPEVSHVLEIIK